MIAILLSTYNGEYFLKEQIESILSQTYKNWKLYIRDDMSSDSTREIINYYTERYSDRIEFIDSNQNFGSTRSFLYLLKNINADGYFFCDQDDIWYPKKLEIMVNYYNNLPDKVKEKPVLIHTAVDVVNERLEKLEKMTKNFNIIKNKRNNDILWNIFNNDVTGCVTFVNSEMKRKCELLENETQLIQHDWFIAMLASYFKTKFYIDEPTIAYRQHQHNSIGVRKDSILKKIKNFLFCKIEYPYYNQTKVFLSVVKTEEDDDVINLLKKFVTIQNKSKIYRIYFHIRYNFFKNKNIIYRIYQLMIC